MRTFNFFEKLWEHGRTLRRVGLVLVMCLMAIPQVWADVEPRLYFGDRLYIDCYNWLSDNARIKVNLFGENGSFSKAMEATQLQGAIYYVDMDGSYKGFQICRMSSDYNTQYNYTNTAWADQRDASDKYMLTLGTCTSGTDPSWGHGPYWMASGHTFYYNNSISQWATPHLRVGRTNYCTATAMSRVVYTKYLYSASTSTWNGLEAICVADKASYTGQGNSIYGKGGDTYEVTGSTTHYKANVNSNMYANATATGDVGGDGVQYYTTSFNTSLPSYNVTVSTATKCSVSLAKYTTDPDAVSPSISSFSSGGGSLKPTQYIKVTVTPNTGYEFSSLSITNAGTKTAAAEGTPGIYWINANSSITAVCTAKQFSISLNNNSGSSGSTSVTTTYNSSTVTSITNPTKSGYKFGGWATTSGGSGAIVIGVDGKLVPGVSGYTDNSGNWVMNNTTTLYAVWLSVHEPGTYVSSSGYDKALKEYSGTKYEIYRYAIDNSKAYVFAGETLTTDTKDKHCVLEAGQTSASASAGWLYHVGGYDNNTSSASWASGQFSAVSSSKALKMVNQSYTICVKGYTAFSLYAQDKTTNGDYYIEVYKDGSIVTKERSTTSGGTVREYSLTSSNTYVIRVQSKSNQSSNDNKFIGFSLTPAAPTVTGPSSSGQELTVGDAATALSVSATPVVAGATLSYQWYVNTTNAATVDNEHKITGATSYSYTPPTTSAGTTYYYCVVSEEGCNSKTSVVSGAIEVSEAATTTYDITDGEPSNGSIAITDGSSAITEAEEDATVYIEATPADGYSFTSWDVYKTGATATKVSTTDATASTTFTMPSYAVTVDASFTCTTPTITGPSDETVCKGASPELSVSASANGGSLSYQWYSNTTKATAGATTLTNCTTYNYSPSTSTVGTMYYYCVVTNTTGSCSATSDIATVTVTAPTAINSQPTNVTNGVVGSASSLSVTATGTGTLTYQWYTCNSDGSSPSAISSATNASAITATLSITPASAGTTYYKCVVHSDCGSDQTSDVVSITAKKNPAQYTVSGTASICSGDDTDITLSDSEDGVTYKLYKGGVDQSEDKVGDGDELTWTVSAEGMYTVKAAEDEDYWELAMSESATVSFKTATSITTQPSTAVAVDEDEEFTLGTGLVATGDGDLSYKWYSYSTSGGADETEIDDETSSTYTTSEASAGTYYYKVEVTAGCGSVKSNMITVTVSSGPCFEFASTSQSSSISSVASGASITASLWESGKASISGGTMKNTGSSSMNMNKSYGMVIESSTNEVTVTLSTGSILVEGTVITLSCHSNNKKSKEYGFKINGNNMSPAKYTTSSDSNDSFEQSYTIPKASPLIGNNSFAITLYNTSNKTYLNGISVASCGSCTSISPTLTYSTTTLYTNFSSTTATPTLDKKSSTGTVTYSSSNTSVATVSSSTGVVTAVAPGEATITASIAYDGTYCPAEATCDITVAGCGYLPVASAVLTSNSAADEYNATAVISGLSGSQKLNDNGATFGMTLTGDSPFKDGDIVNITGTMDADPTTTTFAVYSSSTASSSSLIYTTTLSASAAINVEIEVTGDILTALNTSKTVAVIRTKSPSDGQYNQNPHMSGIYLKRVQCSDGAAMFIGGGENSNWSNTANWLGGKAATEDDRAYIAQAATVDDDDIAAKEIILMQNDDNEGKLTINADAALVVAGTITKTTNGSTLVATGTSDVMINTSSTKQGALIFDNPSGDLQTKATVNLYSKSASNTSQYFATPFESSTLGSEFASSYVFLHDETYEGSWWQLGAGSTVTAFQGLGLQRNGDAGSIAMTGTLASTEDHTYTLTYTSGKSNNKKGVCIVGNSWSAPIQITRIDDDDFSTASNFEGTIYIYNTGKDVLDGSGKVQADDASTEAGYWQSIPIGTAKTDAWTGSRQIPAYQAFQVKVQTANVGFTLNYDKHVRASAAKGSNNLNEPLHAPRRTMNVNDVEVLRLCVTDNNDDYKAYIYLCEGDEFTEERDRGWECMQTIGSGKAGKLYAIDPRDDYMMSIARYSLEGTPVGFLCGSATEYTITFNETSGIYYLNDVVTEQSTLIQEGNSYTFTSNHGNYPNRFVISSLPYGNPQLPTGIENANGEKEAKVRKLLIDDHIYIIRGGKMYTADGALVK